MQNNGATAGNIEVKVYMDGDVSNPSTFQVTLAGPGNAIYTKEDDPWLEMGFSFNAEWGSIDVDFLSYAFGVIAPVAATGLPGDYNDDGNVDAADYVMWRKMNSVGTFAEWKNNFGETQMGSGGGSGVPEPSAAVLLLMSLSLLCASRHR
jgi:hypothetical protein